MRISESFNPPARASSKPAASPPPSIESPERVTVTDLAGTVCANLYLGQYKTMTVGDLKREIQETTGIPINQQALSFDNNVIYRNDQLLSDIISGNRNIPSQIWLIKHAPDVVDAIEIVQKDGLALRELDEKNNKFVVIEAVQRDGHELQYASGELRADRDVVLAAVNNNPFALQYASDELRADRAVVLQAVKGHFRAFQHASASLRSNSLFVSEAQRIANAVQSLQEAYDELRADRAVVLQAVRQNGRALQFASEELRADRAVVLAAVRQNGSALQFASDELRGLRCSALYYGMLRLFEI